MSKFLSLIIGVIIVIAGIALLIAWWYELLFILKGFLPILLILGGGVAVAAGLSEFKDTLKGKK